MHILPPYVALLTLIFLFLSVRTLRLRKRLQIGIGDGGNPQLLRAMRVHSNFAEYVPLCLVLLLLVEGQGAPALLVHGLCVGLLVGRVSHAFGVSQPKEDYRFRIFGMASTFTVLVGSSAYLLFAFARSALA
jgi:hypothetical protein